MSRGKRRPRRVTGQEPLSYMGVEATTPPQVITSDSNDPTVNDNNFDLGSIWVNWGSNDAFILVNIEANEADWVKINNQGLTVNGNTGTATAVDDEMDIVGVGVIYTVGSGSTIGIGHTSTSDGTIVIGESGSVPVWGHLTSSGGTMDITEGPGTLNIDIKGGYLGAQDFDTDSGTATITGNTITIAGGTNINTAGAGSTVTVNLDNDVTLSGNITAVDSEFTSLQVTGISTGFLSADATGLIGNSEGTDGQLIIGATGSPATWANVTSTSGTIRITEGANTLNLEALSGLTSPYKFVYAEFGAGGPVSVGAFSGISSDSTYFVIATQNTDGIYSSTTGLNGSWTLQTTAAGGHFADVHTNGSGPTLGLMTVPKGGSPFNPVMVYYSTTVTGAYTGYAMNVDAWPQTGTSIWFDGTYWVATGTDNNAANATFYTTDPTSPPWTTNTSGITQPLNDCVFGNNTWVVVGDNGFIAYNATDPTGAWTAIAASASGFDRTRPLNPINISAVTYSASLGLFCAVSNEARIATSPDGITWTQRDSNLPIIGGNIKDIHWDSTNGIFVAVGPTNGSAAISYNGISWFLDSSLSNSSIVKVCDLNGKALVGRNSTAYFLDRT